MPKPSEVAKVKVRGTTFQDWETVWVQHRWTDGYGLFRFTCAERDPIPDIWTKLQFKPGDYCEIELGGQLAMTGIITVRQTSYDATTHTVMLSGYNETWLATTSSVDTKDGNFDGMTFEQACRKVLAPYPSGIKVIGVLDATKFDKLQCQPGELIFDFMERIARPRGAIIGSDHLGNVLLIGDHGNPIIQQLTEGDNILRCQCTISKEHSYRKHEMSASYPGSDDQHGRKAAEMTATADGNLGYPRYKKTVASQPVKTEPELQAMVNNDAVWHEGTEIQCNVTVQGWLRDGRNLWRAGDNVVVRSPMAMLNHVLGIQTITFTQDNNGGTLTNMLLVLPWYLRDNKKHNMGDAPQKPAPGKSTSDQPPADPPADTTKKDPEKTPEAPPFMPPGMDWGVP
jgi:prophage tail gpP-like protein